MDSLDQKILTALSANSSVSTSQLARRFDVARSTVQARIERLETTGVIAGYTIKLGDVALERRIKATVLLQVEPREAAQVVSRLRKISEVEAAHSSSGRADLVLQVAAGSTTELDQVLDTIIGVPGIKSSETLIHLSTKFDRVVP